MARECASEARRAFDSRSGRVPPTPMALWATVRRFQPATARQVAGYVRSPRRLVEAGLADLAADGQVVVDGRGRYRTVDPA